MYGLFDDFVNWTHQAGGWPLQPRARTLDDTPVSIGYIYIDRVGDWPSYLLLVPGKSYKLRTSETCDVTGHDPFLYDIYLNYTFR